MINIHIKFEVTHNEDTKGNTECRNWSGLEWSSI